MFVFSSSDRERLLFFYKVLYSTIDLPFCLLTYAFLTFRRWPFGKFHLKHLRGIMKIVFFSICSHLQKKKKKNNSAEYHSPETASVYFLNRELFRSQASVGLRFQSPNWVFALEPERGKQSVSAGGGSDWFCLCPFGLHLFFCREISRRGSMSKCICALPMLLN